MSKELWEYAEKNGLTIYDVEGGYGIRFTDGCDVYWALPKERWHFLHQPDPGSGADQLARFKQLDHHRSWVVEAVRRFLAEQGMEVDRNGRGEWGVYQKGWSSGVDVGPCVTQALVRDANPERVIQQIFKHSALDAPSPIECQRLLNSYGEAIVGHDFVESENRSDNEIPAPDTLELPPVTLAIRTQINARVDEVLRGFQNQPRALESYCDPLWWVEGRDTWTSTETMRKLAEESAGGSYAYFAAEVLGTRASAFRFLPSIEELKNVKPHHEVSEQWVTKIWESRNREPALAQQWFGPANGESGLFCELRASLGDPVAAYHLLAAYHGGSRVLAFDLVPEELLHVAPDLALVFCGADRVEGWKQATIRWAESCRDWDFGYSTVFRVAVYMGWVEVGDALSRNPHIAPALLRPSGDEAAILSADDLVLAWSILAPSDTLEQFLAAAFQTDIRALLGNEFRALNAQVGGNVVEGWSKGVERALSIAWKHCQRER